MEEMKKEKNIESIIVSIVYISIGFLFCWFFGLDDHEFITSWMLGGILVQVINNSNE